MIPLLAEFDRAFADFNVSETRDPTLKAEIGPSQLQLIVWVHEARQGDREARSLFVDTMYWTLREPAFRCFERVHGARAMEYREWFYAKLLQFLNILVHEKLNLAETATEVERPWEQGLTVLGTLGPAVDEEAIQAVFSPEQNNPEFWSPIVGSVCAAPSDRLGVLSQRMAEWGAQRQRQLRSGGREWPRNRERNQIIRNLRARGAALEDICAELDRRTIPTLPAMQAAGVSHWVDAGNDPHFRRHVQQVIWKAVNRPKAVKA
ncbi:MAG: hypothetical protein Q8N47_06390 [Bryobacterales bacterium]|nr:hypothetical protein [Bryobacterales bacterium]